MTLSIIGIGTAVPVSAIDQRGAVELAKGMCCVTEGQAGLLPTLYRRTRVKTRRSVLLDPKEGQAFFQPLAHKEDKGPTTGERMRRYEVAAPELALSAARRAFAESGLTSSEIKQAITVSCTGFMAPGIDLALIKELKLTPTVGRTHVGFMGCHGAFNGLRLASHFVESDPCQNVLLCCVELCSLHFAWGWDPEKMVANALFSDGASALIGVSSDGAPKDAWRLASVGSTIFPDSEDAMTWKIRDHGFEMKLSATVPQLISKWLRPWIKGWLKESGLSLQDVRSWAIHPGGPRILKEVAQTLKLEKKDLSVSEEILAEYGNMSSATLLFMIERLRLRRAPRPCGAVGFGPGLAVEAALFL